MYYSFWMLSTSRHPVSSNSFVSLCGAILDFRCTTEKNLKSSLMLFRSARFSVCFIYCHPKSPDEGLCCLLLGRHWKEKRNDSFLDFMSPRPEPKQSGDSCTKHCIIKNNSTRCCCSASWGKKKQCIKTFFSCNANNTFLGGLEIHISTSRVTFSFAMCNCLLCFWRKVSFSVEMQLNTHTNTHAQTHFQAASKGSPLI